MFDKLAPVPIQNPKHRNLMIFSMTWFLTGTWIDASAHTYLNLSGGSSALGRRSPLLNPSPT